MHRCKYISADHINDTALQELFKAHNNMVIKSRCKCGLRIENEAVMRTVGSCVPILVLVIPICVFALNTAGLVLEIPSPS